MNGIKDWVFSQIVSPCVVSPRQMSGGDNFHTVEPLSSEFISEGSARYSNQETQPGSFDSSRPFGDNLENQTSSFTQQILVEDSHQYPNCNDEMKLDPLTKIEDLQIMFLRLLRRLGKSHDNILVAKVLYRLHLAILIGSEKADLLRPNLQTERARAIAAKQEVTGLPELNFSMRILILGKTGVGKSATINSIFDQSKSTTNAFHPTTDQIEEITGCVNGISLTIIDTPGLLPSSVSNLKRNRKILLSVKRFIRKFPPDIVIYVERLDFINTGYDELTLLKLISDVFGSAIWFHTIPVMTHSSSVLPEGTNGFPVSYEFYVSQCTDILQHLIHQAVSDVRLENHVLLVENHPQCKTNIKGERILPNGQAWKSQFLFLCLCTKVLSDASRLLKFQDSFALGSLRNTDRLPILPHLLSLLLQRHSLSSHGIDEALLSEMEGADEYDQLPPIQILTKSQYEKLTSSQKNAYLNELDYREMLYLKKELKEEFYRRQKNTMNDSQEVESSPDSVLLPDMIVPLSFDLDSTVHRYRCLLTTDQRVVRPVFDPHGWDHDVGFDGINLEAAQRKSKFIGSVVGQVSKDKQDFNVQSECAAAYVSPMGETYCGGLDVQSSGKDLMCTVHSSAKFRKLLHNIAECGVSMTSFRDKYYLGGKLENSVSVGKRFAIVVNVGQMSGHGEVAYSGNLKASFRGKDYPVRQDVLSLAMTILFFNKELEFGGNFESEFRVSRGIVMSIKANLNNRRIGKVCIKTSSSERVEIALVTLLSLFNALLRKNTAVSN